MFSHLIHGVLLNKRGDGLKKMKHKSYENIRDQ